MDLSPEQKATVAKWVAAGDSLSSIQRQLSEHFKVSLTYMDVRFLVDDLHLELKDPKPAPQAEAQAKSSAKAAPTEKKGFLDKIKERVGLSKEDQSSEGEDEPAEDLVEEEEPEASQVEDLEPVGGNVKVELDKISLIPGAMASGTVTFSDGVKGKWIIDQYGRPGFTEIGKPGYRPSPADAQAFMRELQAAISRQGY